MGLSDSMNPPIIHIYPTAIGGVSDFVDVCVQYQSGATKLPLNMLLAQDVAFSGNILLHFSGYGYQKRGVPMWLLKKLVVERAKIKTLGVYFHELYAFGAPWRSAFWLSPLQRHIARRISEISDFWITGREDSAIWLRRYADNKPNAVLPCFSTVGENSSRNENRLPVIVVFGSAALRIATYVAAGSTFFRWLQTHGIELHDIGPTISDHAINELLIQAGATIHGRIDPENVREILSTASFGLVNYPAEYVAKSSVFAAYCAHGVCPILLSKNYVNSDGLVAGQHYLTEMPNEPFDQANIGMAASNWYRPHGVASHVSAQLNLMRGVEVGDH